MYDNDRFKGLEALGNVVGNVNVNVGGNAAQNNDNATIDFNDAVDLAFYATTGDGASLPSFIKKTMIASSVYIQRSCFDDEILSDVLQCAQQLYISWILTAVSLNGCLAGSRTLVKDAINVIASEDFSKPLNRYHIDTKDIIKGIENFGAFPQLNNPFTPIHEEIDDIHNKIKEKMPKRSSFTSSATNPKLQDAISESKLPVGRIVELSLASPSGKSQKINVMVNLYPQVLPDEVMHSLFKLNRVESLTDRWFKKKTGEIKSWMDFLFELDRAREEKNALKKDSSGLLRAVQERNHNNKLAKWAASTAAAFYGLSKNWSYNPAKLKRNVANNILVFNKSDFTRWCKEINLNINMDSDRSRFMFKCLSMMFIILDPDFQIVEMYYHGIKYKSEFSYKQIGNQSKSEKYDLLSLMKVFNNVNAPKF